MTRNVISSSVVLILSIIPIYHVTRVAQNCGRVHRFLLQPFSRYFSTPFSHSFLPNSSLAVNAYVRCQSQEMINSREIVLVSTATIFGAAASAIAFHRFFYSNRLNKRFSANGVVDGRKPSPRNPFDPTKRKGLANYLYIQYIFHSLLHCLLGINSNNHNNVIVYKIFTITFCFG